MKIHTNYSDRLIARLDKPDMERYDIAFGSLDIQEPQTQQLISDLLSLAGIGLPEGAGKINVDAVSDSEDSMYIILTVSDSSRRARRLRVRHRRYLCTLNSQSELFSLCDALSQYEPLITECRLYACDGGYVVELCQRVSDRINLRHVLCEFGTVHPCPTRFRRAEIDEHCTLICNDFIRRLSP